MQFTFGFATSDQIAILLNKNIYKHTGHLRLSIHQVVVQFVYVLIRTSYNLAGFSFIYLYLCVCACALVYSGKRNASMGQVAQAWQKLIMKHQE